MPLDPSIALGVRPVQLDNPADIRAKALSLQQMQRQVDQGTREDAEQQTVRNLYQSSLGANGTVDPQRFVQGLADAGLGDKIPAYQKQLAETEQAKLNQRKTSVEVDTNELAFHKKKLDTLNSGLSTLLANPNVTQQDVIAQINRFVDQGLINEQEGAQAARAVPGQPGAIRPFLIQRALEAQDAAKQLDAYLPKYNEQDRGGVINQGTVDPLTGQRTAGQYVTKTLTPGEVQGAANVATMAGAGVQYQTDANGNIIALPSKPQPGQPITPRPVTDPNGAPTAGRSLNDSQSKALLFGTRAQEAAKIMTALEAKGVNRPSVIKDVAGAIPGIGGALAAGANMTLVSPEQQQLDQAQRDFVNAVLRRESGSAINKDEFVNAKAQYFPQLGDSPEVIAQKAQNRDLAMRGLLSEVPQGMRGQIDQVGQPPAAAAKPPGARPPLSAFGTVKR